jgi:hypothetical protein
MKPEDCAPVWRDKAWAAARKRSEQLRMRLHGGDMGAVIDAALAAVIPLIQAQERKACALVALESPIPDDCGPQEAHGRNMQALGIAVAIRARGEKE